MGTAPQQSETVREKRQEKYYWEVSVAYGAWPTIMTKLQFLRWIT